MTKTGASAYDRMGLLSRQMVVIDGVKLPVNASKERGGKHAELLHRTQPCSPRIATVEPKFGRIRHHKRLNRFTLPGMTKVDAQWSLYSLVHNIDIEKLANHGYDQ